MVDVDAEVVLELSAAENREPVDALGAGAAYPTLVVGARARRLEVAGLSWLDCDGVIWAYVPSGRERMAVLSLRVDWGSQRDGFQAELFVSCRDSGRITSRPALRSGGLGIRCTWSVENASRLPTSRRSGSDGKAATAIGFLRRRIATYSHDSVRGLEARVHPARNSIWSHNIARR